MTGTEILISTDLLKLERVNGKNVGLAQLLPKGKFKHPIFGELNFTEEKFDNAIKNFKAGVPKKSIVINFNHNLHGAIPTAAGWFISLEKTDKFLDAKFDFTDEAAQMIRDKKFKFVSAEVTENFTDNQGSKHGFTVVGAGVTNTPFMTQQNPIMMFSKEGELSEFTEPTKLKILHVNGRDYPLTNEEYVMLQQIMKLLKIEKPEEIDDAIKKLQTPPVVTNVISEPKPDESEAKILELITTNEKLTKDLGVMAVSMKTVTEFTAGLKTTQREKDLNALLEDGYVDAAQIAVLKEKKILEVTDETFKMTIDAYRAGQPLYKDLQTIKGKDDEIDETKPVNKFQKRIDELVKDTAMPDIKEFNDAYEWIFANEPKLAQEYENDQLKKSGSTLKIV